MAPPRQCNCGKSSCFTCPALIPALEQAVTVREVCRVIREHRATCSLCRPAVVISIREDENKEPAQVRREAA